MFEYGGVLLLVLYALLGRGVLGVEAGADLPTDVHCVGHLQRKAWQVVS